MQIGPFENSSRVIVAPMAGVTDRPFRAMCRRYGAYWMVGEMVTSDRRLWDTRKSSLRMQYHDEPGPRWIQIAGADPAMMADAAAHNESHGAQLIDINMGCPAKKVCRKAAGSALLRDERLVKDILDSVVSAVTVPVTLKIRLGWSRDEQNAETVARIAEDSGISLLTVHGRTRACRFQGTVDYESIARVVAAVSMPVVANGDITSIDKARQVLSTTGAAALMLGRAVQKEPWLPAHIDRALAGECDLKAPEQQTISDEIIHHVEALSVFYGEVMGVRIARKHVGWQIDDRDVLARFNQLEHCHEQVALIADYFDASQRAA
ncbi:MAG: tRNA dihydrouridine synthase DusB [Gammaproteobacteria bacterium]|nr:tRNA dihydrouridine synthase DusB [Gammaproteobacteria bacterium]OUU10881.1 MAG: tRNA dihydrouridine synthase DusB [Gammaproteobacteria bacterium TMED34]